MAGSLGRAVYDSLFSLYMAIAFVVAALVLAWLAIAIFRFRARTGERAPLDAPRAGIEPDERGHAAWVYVMAGGIALVMFGLAFGTIGAVDFIEHPPGSEEALDVNVTAFQFGWRFQTEDGIKTINELRVPVDRPVVLSVTSQDVFHNFAVPEYRIRIDAMPGKTNTIWFQATEAGTVESVCVELCGLGHAHMKGTIVAMAPADYDAWVTEKLGGEPK